MRFLLTLLISFLAFTMTGQTDTTIKLDVQQVDEIVISSKRKEVAFADEKYFVMDFEINQKGIFLLLVNLGKYRVYHLNENMEVDHELQLNGKPRSLYTDCFGHTHVMTKDSLWMLNVKEKELQIAERNSKMLYIRVLRHCKAETSNHLIFEHLENFNQSQSYRFVDKRSSVRRFEYRIEDSLLIKSAYATHAEILAEGYSDHRRMRDVNGEMGSTAIRRLRDQQENKLFFQQAVTHPKYNPLFNVNDTLTVFNHHSGRVDVLTESGQLQRSVPIDYHQRRNWKAKIYLDQRLGRFYSAHILHGITYLNRLAIKTFQPERTTAISKHPYPKKVIILNGFAYYTYRPNYDANLNRLYRQKL